MSAHPTRVPTVIGAPLENPKHEAIAQQFVKQRFSTAAVAKKLGYSTQWITRLTKQHPAIMTRVGDLLANASQALRIDVTIIKQEIARVAYADITDVLRCVTVEDIIALDANVRRAIKKVKSTRRTLTDGTLEETVEIEMHSKMEALRLLTAVEGMQKTPDAGLIDRAVFTGVTLIISK